MDIEKDSGFWIPPDLEKKDQPDVGIPAYVPLPDNTPPPEFDPTKEQPDMEDHPREDHDLEKPDQKDEPEEEGEEEVPHRGSSIINDDEKDDRDYDPFKDDDAM